ncbi:phosphonoacetaldehyde hydrolase [Negativibacillus massiliensis]|uniref:phosphonoacetaldehyde hydrolase n=1 Tax=Negativibacillus massiliensis TaxID=1871035 RepID=UPI003AF1FFF1
MIEAVIFDWAGTAVDYGCFAPVQAFREAFAHYDVPVTMEETRKPMGMLKRDHIRTMMKMERVAAEWKRVHGREATEEDVEAVYAQFEPKLFSILENYSSPKPFVLETVDTLRKMGIKIGSSTGYTDAMMDIVVKGAAKEGYSPDFWISPDGVGGKGRPYPYMIFENMKVLGVSSVKNVVKVGDTVSDIREGVSAGVWSVGVIEGSSELGLTQEEFEQMSPEQKEKECCRVEQVFRKAGADFVIDNLSQLPALIRMLGK